MCNCCFNLSKQKELWYCCGYKLQMMTIWWLHLVFDNNDDDDDDWDDLTWDFAHPAVINNTISGVHSPMKHPVLMDVGHPASNVSGKGQSAWQNRFYCMCIQCICLNFKKCISCSFNCILSRLLLEKLVSFFSLWHQNRVFSVLLTKSKSAFCWLFCQLCMGIKQAHKGKD